MGEPGAVGRVARRRGHCRFAWVRGRAASSRGSGAAGASGASWSAAIRALDSDGEQPRQRGQASAAAAGPRATAAAP